MAAATSEKDQDTCRPIACVLDAKRGFFVVTRSKGKSLASGGFGISLLDEKGSVPCDDILDATQQAIENGTTAINSVDIHHDDPTTNNNAQEDTTSSTAQQSPSPPKKATEILFVEEVVFLHQQGLLTATTITETDNEKTPLDTSQLYQLLPKMGISLAVFLTYSHLRSQAFRVLRHDPHRLDILRQQQEDGLLSKENMQKLRKQVRASIQTAPPPRIPTMSLQICWDVYHPSAQFGKTHPGLPDFYVAASYYAIPSVTFSQLKDLIIHDDGIPLKIAVVSDSGTVVMFGVTDCGIPPLATTIHNNNGNDEE